MNRLKYIFLDVDGTLTDGGLYIDSDGRETKRFCVQDGAAILIARAVGIESVIVTRRASVCVEQRAKELGISFVFQNVMTKSVFVEEFTESHRLEQQNLAYIGDDLNDLFAMKKVGFVGCPSNAADEVKAVSHYIAKREGGYGAVRECIEFMLKKSGLWEAGFTKLFGENR